MENEDDKAEALFECVDQLKEDVRAICPFMNDQELTSFSCIVVSIAGSLAKFANTPEQEEMIITFMGVIKANLFNLIKATEVRVKESKEIQEMVDGKRE